MQTKERGETTCYKDEKEKWAAETNDRRKERAGVREREREERKRERETERGCQERERQRERER